MPIPNHVQDHIDTIAKHEQEFLTGRSPAERLGDLTAAVVGSLGFVAVHIFLFLSWILVTPCICRKFHNLILCLFRFSERSLPWRPSSSQALSS